MVRSAEMKGLGVVMNNFLANAIIAFIGFSAGAIIAGGLFAFIAMVGVVTRLIARTRTAKTITFYEDLVILGATLGNLFYLFDYSLPVGTVGLVVFGTFSGIFVGCLAVALAETVNAIPVFAHRVKLQKGMSFLVLSMALGKSLGTLYQLYFMWSSNS